MVRVGQAVLGYALDEELRAIAEAGGTETGFEFAREALTLEPAVRWISSVVHLAEIPPGWPVGPPPSRATSIRSGSSSTRA